MIRLVLDHVLIPNFQVQLGAKLVEGKKCPEKLKIWLGAVYQSTFETGALDISKIKKWCHLPVFLIRFQLGLHFRVNHSNLRCNIDNTAITCDLTKLSCQAEKHRKKL